jgi:ABC-type phosphate transport system auxiliary subunit
MAHAKQSKMSEAHKAAIVKGRAEVRAVKAYLEALDGDKNRARRRRSAETIKSRLRELEDESVVADPLQRLHLAQERIDLEAELDSTNDTGPALEVLQEEFVTVAASYAARKGVGYAAFRELGVPAAVLRRAGLSRKGA